LNPNISTGRDGGGGGGGSGGGGGRDNTGNWIIELGDEFSANTFKAPHKATLEYQINKL